MHRTLQLGVCVVCLLVSSCNGAELAPTPTPTPSPPPPAVKPRADALATVNGVPISPLDVKYAMRNSAPEQKENKALEQSVLETIVRKELMAQRATELGLDKDPMYVAELGKLEAQVSAFKREKLSDALYAHEVAAKSEPTEGAAKRFYDQNGPRIRTTLHVEQILVRDEGKAKAALAEIKAGAAFEDVAKKLLPKLPEGQTPWDLGTLHWKQVPVPWTSVVYDLQPGQTSGIIAGQNGRFWIVKLIEKKEDPSLTFDAVKAVVMDDLKNARMLELGAEVDKTLRDKATIVTPDRTDRATTTRSP